MWWGGFGSIEQVGWKSREEWLEGHRAKPIIKWNYEPVRGKIENDKIPIRVWMHLGTRARRFKGMKVKYV